MFLFSSKIKYLFFICCFHAFKIYEAKDETEFFHNNLTNRRKRVNIGSDYYLWNDIAAGIPPGSTIGPLLFNIFMNNLACVRR